MRYLASLTVLLSVVFLPLRAAEQSSETKIPEISAVTDSYQKVIAGIKATRLQRSARVIKDYATRLEQLRKEVTAAGDLEAALAVKGEQERLAKNEETPAAKKDAMTGKLLAIRTAFEREREPFYQAADKEKEQAVTKYLADLATVQERLTKSNRLDRAKIVQAVRDKIAEKGEVPEHPDAPNVASAPSGSEKLAVTLATKIKAAVESKAIKKTLSSRKETEGATDTPADGAILLGFELSEMNWEGAPAIKTLRPIFLSREGLFTGKLRGTNPGKITTVKARAGYAVSGLNTFSNSRLSGLQIIFSKYDSAGGKFITGSQNSYSSKWYASKGKGAPVTSGDTANLIVGVYGLTGTDVDTIGLVEMP